jgi:hypothetical protein
VDVVKRIGFGGLVVFILLFALAPVTRISIIIITLMVFISVSVRNPISIYLFYSAIGFFLSFIVAISRVGSMFYQSAELAGNFVLILTLGNILDLIIYVESSTWTTIGNLLAALVFGGLGFLSYTVTNK